MIAGRDPEMATRTCTLPDTTWWGLYGMVLASACCHGYLPLLSAVCRPVCARRWCPRRPTIPFASSVIANMRSGIHGLYMYVCMHVCASVCVRVCMRACALHHSYRAPCTQFPNVIPSLPPMQPSIAITLIVIFLISVYVCVVVPLLLLFYKYKGRTGAPTAYKPLNEVPCAHTTAYTRPLNEVPCAHTTAYTRPLNEVPCAHTTTYTRPLNEVPCAHTTAYTRPLNEVPCAHTTAYTRPLNASQ